MSLPEGTAVGGRYVLGHQEGSGGFSICYRAWDQQKSDIIAIKELFPAEVARRLDDGGVWVDPEYREDFDTAVLSLRHEWDVLRQLTKDPGIVRVGDVFMDNGTAYLPMEFLRGQSYQKYLDDALDRTGAHIDVKVAVNIVLAVLGALDAVHARGLLHLDVKPANIRVLDDARVVLLDFGSARDAFRQGIANYGRTFTPGYAALEQHDASGHVTEATDVYALAATLYYSLSLTLPTRADYRENGDELPDLSTVNPDVPQELDRVIQKAMALDPADRYPSVGALKKVLEPFGSPRGLTIRQLALPVRVPAPAPLRIASALLDLAATSLLLAAVIDQELVPQAQIAWAAVLLWWFTQLVPIVAEATPGMLMIGLRLTNEHGGPISLRALLLRPFLFVVGVVCCRFWPDADGRFMHDRAVGSRVLVSVVPSG
jgi:serine/threonine protein kinase